MVGGEVAWVSLLPAWWGGWQATHTPRIRDTFWKPDARQPKTSCGTHRIARGPTRACLSCGCR